MAEISILLYMEYFGASFYHQRCLSSPSSPHVNILLSLLARMLPISHCQAGWAFRSWLGPVGPFQPRNAGVLRRLVAEWKVPVIVIRRGMFNYFYLYHLYIVVITFSFAFVFFGLFQ
jgi:hypothetical protein